MHFKLLNSSLKFNAGKKGVNSMYFEIHKHKRDNLCGKM